MDKKIVEYWEQKTKAENIVDAFCNLYWTSRATLEAVLKCYTKKDFLAAAKVAEQRNCMDFVCRELWARYHKQ